MTETQIWTMLGFFAAFFFSVFTMNSVMFTRVLRTEIKGVNERIGGVRSELLGAMQAMDGRLTGEMRAMDSRINGRIDALEGTLNGRIDGLQGEVSGLRGEMNARFDAVETRIDGLDSDVQVLAESTFGK